jgi:hypothetical protein
MHLLKDRQRQAQTQGPELQVAKRSHRKGGQHERIGFQRGMCLASPRMHGTQ